MIDYQLTESELQELRLAHRQAANKREAYRINAVILLGSGWSAEAVGQALLIDPDTVRNAFKQYRGGGIALLRQVLFRGGTGWLTDNQLCALEVHVQAHLPLSAREGG